MHVLQFKIYLDYFKETKTNVMKKATISLFVLMTFNVGFTATVPTVKPPLKASQIFLPVGKAGQMISLEELSVIRLKDYETLTGKKMKVFDKIGFRIAQNQLRNSINYDGTFSKKKVEKYFSRMADGTKGFHSGGFFLGLLVGLIGVIIAYIIKDEKKKNRVKWAWIGWGVWVVIAIILISTTAYTVY